MGAYSQYIYFLPLLVMIGVIFYSSNKRKKDQTKLMDSLKVGDKIVTIGGIKGTIVKINEEDNSVDIKIDNNARLTLVKSAIARKG